MTSTQTHMNGPQGSAPEISQGPSPCCGAVSKSLKPSSQGTFVGARSLKLFYQSWYPKPTSTTPPEITRNGVSATSNGAVPSPQAQAKAQASSTNQQTTIKGVLALVHGLGEHSGRYCNVVHALTAAGYAVFAFDNQGHGKSEGQRGHINRWQDYRDNTQTFLQLVRRQEPTVPLFVMGHSLGGLIVLDCVLRNSQTAAFKALAISGLAISAPPIEPCGGTANQIRIVLARLLSGIFPRLSLKMGLDECGLSRDQEVADKIAEDPLIHPYVTLRWGSETLKTIDWVKAHIEKLRLPILLTHGEADPIIAPTGSQEIFQRIQTPNKTLTIYPGSYHEPHNDLDSKVVVADLVNWLNNRLETAAEVT